MVLTTTTSAGGKWIIYSGTDQEVATALDSHAPGIVVGLSHDGATTKALVKART